MAPGKQRRATASGYPETTRRRGNAPTTISPDVSRTPPASLVALTRLLARQAAREAVAQITTAEPPHRHEKFSVPSHNNHSSTNQGGDSHEPTPF